MSSTKEERERKCMSSVDIFTNVHFLLRSPRVDVDFQAEHCTKKDYRKKEDEQIQSRSQTSNINHLLVQ